MQIDMAGYLPVSKNYTIERALGNKENSASLGFRRRHSGDWQKDFLPFLPFRG
jgi:hypothetical protein